MLKLWRSQRLKSRFSDQFPNTQMEFNTQVTRLMSTDINKVHFFYSTGIDVNTQDDHGRTALHLTRDLDIAKLLVQYGADVNAKDNSSNTPLAWSASPDIAQILIAAGADIHHVNNAGHTITHCLVREEDMESLKVVIAAGADANAQDDCGLTVMHLICQHWWRFWRRDCNSLVSFLIAAGADVNIKDQFGRSPLRNIYFFKEGDINVNFTLFDIFKHAGSDLNSQDSSGNTLLHEICDIGMLHNTDSAETDFVHLLILAGADVSLENHEGRTPLHCAKNVETAALLIDNGAKMVVDEEMPDEVIGFIQSRAARIIQKACENWLWKPVCNDGTPGIQPRLLMKHAETLQL